MKKHVKNIEYCSNDDDVNYKVLDEFLSSDAENKKLQFLNEISERGEGYLNEITTKKQNQEKLKKKLILYIVKHSNVYNINELNSYDLSDIIIMYNQEKKRNSSLLSKIFQFIYNV